MPNCIYLFFRSYMCYYNSLKQHLISVDLLRKKPEIYYKKKKIGGKSENRKW